MELQDLINTLRDKNKDFFDRMTDAENASDVTHHMDTFELEWYTEFEPLWDCDRTYFFIRNTVTGAEVEETTGYTPDESWLLLWSQVVEPGETVG